MRLPFPERLPLYQVSIFCLVLCLIQQAQGTTALFSFCTAAFILLAAVAFNIAGGLARPSGGYIFMYASIAVIFGIVYKAVVGEPAQSNLLQPELTIELYVGSIAALLLAAYLAKKVRLKRGYLPIFKSDVAMYRGSVGCLIIGGGITMILFVKNSSVESGSVLSALSQLNNFLPLSLLLGVTAEIRRSGGKRSVNSTVLITMVLLFSYGVLNYGKQIMLTPFVCWLLPAAAQRYKVSILQMAGFLAALAFTLYYLVPYSQYGRNFKGNGTSLSEDVKTNILLLSNLDVVRKVYLQNTKDIYAEDNYHYYNQPQGIADRTQMITPDDAIINATEQGNSFGIFPTISAFQNIVPRFLWPGKPTINWGNIYAHELGILSDDDTTTGISFSPTGEAYHEAKWAGVLVLLPLLAFMLFVIADSVCGDTRLSPFALLPLLVYSHQAPEGGLFEIVAQSFTGIVEIFFAALIGAYLMPLLASLILGAPKDQQREAIVIASQPRRFMPPESPSATAES